MKDNSQLELTEPDTLQPGLFPIESLLVFTLAVRKVKSII